MGTMGLPYGLQAMLKDGHKHFSGVDEAVVKNIEACRGLSNITRTSLGPNGMNKMVINHLDKLFVTSDTATIMTELEVEHPAAKLLVMAAKAQEAEIGDATNLVISLAGELLAAAGDLLRDGLHTSEVADGYAAAGAQALTILETLIHPASEDLDVRSSQLVARRITGVVASRFYGYEAVLCPLIADACIAVCPKNPANFNVDNVRVAKIPGGGVQDSHLVQGMLIKRDAEGTLRQASNAKVAVFAQGLDTSGTETKGTVLLRNAEELQSYSRSEEDRMEQLIKGIADSGALIVAAGSSIGEMAMHFVEKYGLMAVRIPSKFDLRRFCRATGSTALAKVGTPTAEELGFAKSLKAVEIGGTNCLLLQQETSSSGGGIATVVLRAATDNVLDDLERAVDDGVNAYKAVCKDARTVAAGGGAELEVARQLAEHGRKVTGLEQYAYAKFAEALEVVPRVLAENSGLNATEAVNRLQAAHAEGNAEAGLDIETGQPSDLRAEKGLVDLYIAKWWAIKLAVDATTTILRVDQIIMAKQAGGPKPRGDGAMDDD